MTKHNVHLSNTEAEFSQQVQDFLTDILSQKTASETIQVFRGSMPKVLCPILKQLDQKNIDRIRLFPVDERLVPVDDPENNVGAYLKLLPQCFEDCFAQVEHIEDANLAASTFEETLKQDNSNVNAAGCPIFDVLFLGLGPDGHTCSLFPRHPLLKENKKWIAPIEDSPKPPARRVTITLPVLNLAQNVAFLVTGESKAKVVQEIVSKKNASYPPSLIQRDQIHWFLDESAASQMTT
uniref:6-phosphogluconolactonase n=1 Tax=Ditylenchus dipsaci TaxID=166011 RepID=A0A915E7A7_9BILA